MTNAAFCRTCGKALSEEEKAQPGNIHCAACKPAAAQPPPIPSPYAIPPGHDPNAPSPGLAFLLGLLPGVGACYNGQFAKGLVHVFVFGMLISIANAHFSHDIEPLIVMMILAWIPYMAFEAYHTAQARASGKAVDEFSSLVSLKAGGTLLPAALIVFGVIFLLNNLELLRLVQVLRFWPIALIALGVYMLIERVKTTSHDATLAPPIDREVRL
ncbi:MAG: DUF5668 domain-containing protein [Bryobacteraceae bacterium]